MTAHDDLTDKAVVGVFSREKDFSFSLGQKAGKLSGISPFRLWLDGFSGRSVIRIGS